MEEEKLILRIQLKIKQIFNCKCKSEEDKETIDNRLNTTKNLLQQTINKLLSNA